MRIVPDSATLREYNKCHHPGGRPDGGRFCDTAGGSDSPAPANGGLAPPAAPAAERIELPDDPTRYFIIDAQTVLVPLDKLQTVRARPEGIANAEPLMRAAFEGAGGKRKPISLKANPDGTYTVLDGNSTTAIARKHGWRAIAAHITP